MTGLIEFIILIVVALLIIAVATLLIDRVPFIDAAIKQLLKYGVFAIGIIYVLLQVIKLIEAFA